MTTAAPGTLNLAHRRATLARMRTVEYDVLVIGGGVTGAGAALDAVSRGLEVALLEKRDFAAGTSSRSGKFIHGGLRYLEQLNFRLVRESLRERRLLLRTIAPHLSRPLELFIPLSHHVWERIYLGAGLLLYDTLAGAGAVPRHRHLSRKQALRHVPSLDPRRIVGGLAFHDVQIDDARHTLELVRTAAADGADVASALTVTGFLRSGDAVTGVTARDLLTGDTLDIKSSHVINASGVWSDGLQDILGARASFQVQTAKGVHILIPRSRLRSDFSLFLRAEDSILVARQWGDYWLIGTTDTPWSQDLDHPAATRTDIEYILRNLNRGLADADAVTADDIVGVYAGLRPLVSGRPGTTSKLSREHAIETVLPGFTTISGGKYTTYRVMAQDVVDHALSPHGTPPASRTSTTPMLGARGFETAKPALLARAAAAGLAPDVTLRLLARYGVLLGEILDAAEQRPGLLHPLSGAPTYLRAEISYAATHEGALDLEDALVRRTHIAIETRDRGLAAAEEAASLLSEALGWDGKTTRDRLKRYRARVAAERASQQEATDAAASQMRTTTVDFRVRADMDAARAPITSTPTGEEN